MKHHHHKHSIDAEQALKLALNGADISEVGKGSKKSSNNPSKSGNKIKRFVRCLAKPTGEFYLLGELREDADAKVPEKPFLVCSGKENGALKDFTYYKTLNEANHVFDRISS